MRILRLGARGVWESANFAANDALERRIYGHALCDLLLQILYKLGRQATFLAVPHVRFGQDIRSGRQTTLSPEWAKMVWPSVPQLRDVFQSSSLAQALQVFDPAIKASQQQPHVGVIYAAHQKASMDNVVLPLKLGRVILEGIVDMKLYVRWPECWGRILGIGHIKCIDSCSLVECAGKLTRPNAQPPSKSERTQRGFACSCSPSPCAYICNTKTWPIDWKIVHTVDLWWLALYPKLVPLLKKLPPSWTKGWLA
ncbi:MAG: hypothetical protein Q9207_007643 [Kuettlingeria erythrocarpa]